MNNFETYYNHFISLGYNNADAERMAILEVQADENEETYQMESEFIGLPIEETFAPDEDGWL